MRSGGSAFPVSQRFNRCSSKAAPVRQHIKEAGKAANVPQLYTHLLSSEIQGEIYDLYCRVRTPDFFESEEAIAI
ncbi:MAG: hypothetical protein M1468_02585 [Candidatus Thermoplasmatota archaeon]|nr:hypothetical protein [Candidatus Thermoplasmatota archaeon]